MGESAIPQVDESISWRLSRPTCREEMTEADEGRSHSCCDALAHIHSARGYVTQKPSDRCALLKLSVEDAADESKNEPSPKQILELVDKFLVFHLFNEHLSALL